VSGEIIIETKVYGCNCSNYTSLYVNRAFISNGTLFDTDYEFEYFRHQWNTTTVSNGKCEIIVFDKHMVSYDVIYLYVSNVIENNGNDDNTRIVEPKNNSIVGGLETVTAEVRTCNCTSFTSLHVDGVHITSGNFVEMVKKENIWWEIYTHKWDTSNHSDGVHTLMVLGKHQEHYHEIEVMIDNDNHNDNGSIRMLFPNNNSSVSGRIRIGVEVSSSLGIGYTSLHVDGDFSSNGTLDSSIGGLDYFSHEWDSASVSDGQHEIGVKYSKGGLSTTAAVIVNNSGAAVLEKPVWIITPDMNAELKDTVSIRVEVNSKEINGSSVLYVDEQFISEGTLDISVGEYSYFTHKWDTSNHSDGVHLLKVEVSGGTYLDVISVYVNNTEAIRPDTMKIVSPSNRSNVEGIAIIKVDILENEDENGCTLYIDGNYMANYDNSTRIKRKGAWFRQYILQWNSRSSTNGYHDIMVMSGNMKHSHLISVFVLNPLEEMVQNTRLLYPLNNTVLNGKVTISIEVLVICDCNSTTLLLIDGKPVSNGIIDDRKLVNGSWFEIFIHHWDTASMGDGTHELRTLGKHKQYYDTVMVIVDNSDDVDDGSGSSEDTPGFDFFTLLIGLIIIIFLAVNRWRRP